MMFPLKVDCQQTEFPAHPALDDLSSPLIWLSLIRIARNAESSMRAWQNIPFKLAVFARKMCGLWHADRLALPCGGAYDGAAVGVALGGFSLGMQLAAMLVFTWLLVAMAVIDFDHKNPARFL